MALDPFNSIYILTRVTMATTVDVSILCTFLEFSHFTTAGVV